MFQVRVGDKLYSADSQPSSNYTPVLIAKARAVQWFALAYCAAAVIYVIFTVFTQTGLGGYALAIEMETFGSSAAFITGGLLWLVLFVPLLVFLVILKKIDPRLVNYHREPSVPKQGDVTISWKLVFGIAGVPFLLTAVAASILAFVEYQDLKATVYKVNLDAANSAIPQEARVVELTGVPKGRYVAAYRIDETDHVFAPMTGSAWTPDDAVRVVAYRTVSLSSSDQSFAMPADLGQRGPTTIRGKISKFLPVVIERSYKSKGLKIAPLCLVVEEAAFPNASGAYESATLTGIVGGSFSTLVLAILILIKVREPKEPAKTTASL
jgi:hypothetical protein